MKCEICEQQDACYIEVLGELSLCETCLISLVNAGYVDGQDVEDLRDEMLFLRECADVTICGSNWAI